MWEYREDNGSYTRYSAEHSALLEAAATEGWDMLELRSSQAAYTVMIDYGKGGVLASRQTRVVPNASVVGRLGTSRVSRRSSRTFFLYPFP